MGRQDDAHGGRQTKRFLAMGSVCVLLVGLLVLVGFRGQGCVRPSSDVWAGMQDDLADTPIVSVRLRSDEGGLKQTVVGDEAEDLSRAFLAGAFDEDNSQCFGPTPGIVLGFAYEGREYFTIAQWPDGRFELSRAGTHFLIAAPELAEILRLRGYVYER